MPTRVIISWRFRSIFLSASVMGYEYGEEVGEVDLGGDEWVLVLVHSVAQHVDYLLLRDGDA